ncbi:tripartite tricarboxylate transporter substrate binding protein [Piscinibacter sakaiensis]|uniref:Putative exported protein n=1 Tax=Piscinibacter sakaiensis TaxID=1547922 RepID=A0A0K8P5X5_PISS1|nr:tripartite tricarboxylate transporter substrate binding protein [Piscinibacter sakaiensis]GAP38012.1 putative exported protein [Piscinibacter sakaiensis]
MSRDLPRRPRRLAVQALVAAGAIAWAAGAAAADAWPSKTITIVVPFAPGGNTDTLARLVSERLGTALKQTVIVENKPGAGSMLGSAQVARATPDGYTLLLGSISNALNQHFYKKPSYDITKDLVPVAQLVAVPNYLALGPKEKFANVAELIGYAKANPGKLSCATTGVGTSPFLSCELFKSMAGVDIVNVPYKGGAPAMQDTMGGQANMVFANEALPFIADKRLQGLAVTTTKRSPLAPTIPAMSETLPGYDVTAWYGLFAPTGTPPAVVDRLAAEVAQVMKDEAVLARLKTLGATPVPTGSKEFTAYVNAEVKRWGEVIRPMNISLD